MTDRWILLSFLEKGSKITEDFGQNHKAKKVEPKAENPLFGVCVCVCVREMVGAGQLPTVFLIWERL